MPEDKLIEISNWLTEDIWNKGFSDISSYFSTGKSSTGEELDIDFTKSQLAKVIEKKADYDKYITGLDESYLDIKEIWNKLSPEIDNLYQQIESGVTELNTDRFKQYFDAFYDAVYDY